ncbi:MAG TPA: hypothetical protein VN673_02450 [Clostridia bacterium]|nr:hypothetical protein [Clostridia bacterium]
MTTHESVADAIISAEKIRQQATPPSIHEFLTPPADEDLSKWPTLFARHATERMQFVPSTLFEHVDFNKQPVPREWLGRYLEWALPVKRWEQFKTCHEIWSKKGTQTRIDEMQINNGALAGLLLFLCPMEADAILRHFLISWAITEPLGAYFFAEGHHVPEERPAIAEALHANPRLLFWLGQLPYFRKTVLAACYQRGDIWAGLAIAERENPDETIECWLNNLLEKASSNAEAAAAALVLQPHAPHPQRKVWRSVLKQERTSRHAFDCLWWSRFSWDTTDFGLLVEDLGEHATNDRSMLWYNWAAQDLEWGMIDFETAPVDPLWSVEFLERSGTGRKRLETTLRKQMVERLQRDCTDRIAPIVLLALNAGTAK